MKGSTKLWLSVGTVICILFSVLFSEDILYFMKTYWRDNIIVYVVISSIITILFKGTKIWHFLISPFGWFVMIIYHIIVLIKWINKWADENLKI